MQACIDLYRLGVCRLKSIHEQVELLAEALELPEDALLGAAKVTVTAGRRLVVENHSGVLSYGEEQIVLKLPRGKLSILGEGLSLTAMTRDRLIISGRIRTLEWE